LALSLHADLEKAHSDAASTFFVDQTLHQQDHSECPTVASCRFPVWPLGILLIFSASVAPGLGTAGQEWIFGSGIKSFDLLLLETLHYKANDGRPR